MIRLRLFDPGSGGTTSLLTALISVNGQLKVPTFGQVKVPTQRSFLLALTSS